MSPGITDRPVHAEHPTPSGCAPPHALLLDGEAERALDQLTSLAAEVLCARLGLVVLSHQGEMTLASCAGSLPPARAWADGVALLPLAGRALETAAPVLECGGGQASPAGALLAVPLRGEAGRAIGALAVAADAPREWSPAEVRRLQGMAASVVSELDRRAESVARQRAEAALERSEVLFRRMVESANDIIYRADPEGFFTYANPAAERVTGYPETELLSMHFRELVRPDHQQQISELYARQIAERIPVTYLELPIVSREGAEIWIGQNVQLLSEGDRVLGIQAVARDITAQRQVERALRESEKRFRNVVESLGQGLVITDEADVIQYANPRMAELTGYALEELTGGVAYELLFPEEEHKRAREELQIRLLGVSSTYEVRQQRRDGSHVWLEVHAVPYRDADGEVVGSLALVEDVTDRRRTEEEGQRLAALSRKNPNPVLECDAEGRPVHVNPAAEEISRELGLEGVEGLLPQNHGQLVRASLESDQSFQSVEAAVGDRIFSWTYRPFPGTRSVYLFAVDITSRRLMEEQLRHDALHDALTGLPNRLLFLERLAHAILHSRRRPPYQFAVLFLDLDRFKVVNDSLGHHVGDELLCTVAARLQGCLRPADTVARLGGDEFAILLEDIEGVEDATRIAERIQSALASPVNLSGFDVFTSASIGIALSSLAYERPEYLLRNADMAMYRAKAVGQARFEVFDRAMHAQALTRLQVETDLRRAVEREEFRVHYQPIVTLRSGRMQGVEALVRWAHPDRGWMSPDEFIPVAEETGVILAIGEWVLREACRQVKRWQAEFPGEQPVYVGVNLSAKQFSQPDLVEMIAAVLEQTGLPPGSLRLEITESAIMDNAESAVALLGRLKELGVHISLDDFGTGYSSLSYLHRFPLDALKIDRTFVGRMDEEHRSAQLVHTVLTLARSLGAAAVAEGIETEAQLEALRRMDCDYGQGFLFSRPLPPEELEEMLRRRPEW